MDVVRLSPATRSFGYAAALEAELARIGPISIEEFERRYPASPAQLHTGPSGDPLTTARFGEIFRRDPKELLRQQVAAALDKLLPIEPGLFVPNATLDSLFLLWDTFEAAQKAEEKQHRGPWGEAWEAVMANIQSHPLLTIVAQWENWERQRLEALRGLRFETGSDLLAWLEDDAALRLQEINEEALRRKRMYEEQEASRLKWLSEHKESWRMRMYEEQGRNLSEYEQNRVSDEEALTQGRQRRLHQLHRYLTGHYGIHSDFRLTDEENALLRENDFVVTQRLGAGSFGDLYYHLFNNDLPVFVTIDSLLHAWHHSYDAILMELEENCLMVALDDILAGMSRQLRAAQQAYGDGLLAESLQDTDYYLAVALSLLRGEPVPTQFDQDPHVAATLQACAAQQMQNFPLFGCDRVVDFSQFKPRGHYEKSEALQRYFRAMMWVGRIELRVAGGDDPREIAQRQLGAALVLRDLLNRADKFAAWQQFDNLIQTFVGVTDSMTFAQLETVVQKADIQFPGEITHWSALERLQAIILEDDTGYQQIASDFYLNDPNTPQQVALPRSFTLMGQKFTLDSWALGQTVFDRVLRENEKVMRRVPSCLDVAFTVLGNDQTVPELVRRLRDQEGRVYRDGLPYQHNLAALRAVLDAQDESVWDASLYTQWLHCLRALSTPTTGVEYPRALRTPAWAAKSLNTQMASWTHLRHDTILYVKQAYTISTVCFHPAGYVEPNPLFWTRLEKMAFHAADLLAQTTFLQPTLQPSPTPPAARRFTRSERNIEMTQDDLETLLNRRTSHFPRPQRNVKEMQEKQVAFLRQFAATVSTLRGIAAKQATQTETTEEERKFLQDIVQVVQEFGSGGGRSYNGWYPTLFYEGPAKCAEADPLVADVHTDTPSEWPPDPGCVLHQGVGGVDLLVIAVDIGEEQVIFAGPTLSHYEFEMPGISRKADSEWKADLTAGRFPPRPSWTQAYLVAANHIPSLEIVPSNSLF